MSEIPDTTASRFHREYVLDEYTLQVYRTRGGAFWWRLVTLTEYGLHTERISYKLYDTEAEAISSAVHVYRRIPLVIV